MERSVIRVLRRCSAFPAFRHGASKTRVNALMAPCGLQGRAPPRNGEWRKSLANKSVGVIGLGLMGEVFSRRLIDGGQSVFGYDIDAAKGVRLADMGARAAASIAELARACDPIVLAVFNTSQVEDVVENNILPAVGETSRKILLCASTCDPDRIAALGERVMARGIRFLETPVSGTSEQVRRGDGVGLIGGHRDTAEEADAVLAILFPRRFHVGDMEAAREQDRQHRL